MCCLLFYPIGNSIHVSDTTYKLLNEIGIYKLVEHTQIDYEVRWPHHYLVINLLIMIVTRNTVSYFDRMTSVEPLS